MASALAVTSCALNSGVVPVAPGVWTISERRAAALGGAYAAQQAAMEEASVFCAGRNGAVLPLSGDVSGHPEARFGPTDFTVFFRCAPPPQGGGAARSAPS